LKDFREKELGLSVWKVAQASNTYVDNIKAVEEGKTNYTIDTFLKYIHGCDLYMYFATKDKKVEPHDFSDMISKA
jgi:hypothetical protein